MELKIIPGQKNLYPKRGILIRNASPWVWLKEIEQMGLTLESVAVFPIPSTMANELYGCLVVLEPNAKTRDLRGNNAMQLAAGKLFIPENTQLWPILTDDEWNRLFEHFHVLHPEFGLVSLQEPIDWSDLLMMPSHASIEILQPNKGVFIPDQIQSLRIEANANPMDEMNGAFAGDRALIDKLPFSMEKLMNGNKREVEKFLAFMEKNPEMALSLAIPLDTLNSLRGNQYGKFKFGNGGGFGGGFGGSSRSNGLLYVILSIVFLIMVITKIAGTNTGGVFDFLIVAAIIWFIIKMAGNSNGSGGSSTALIDMDSFNTLQQRYVKLAEDYVAKGEYLKAANIYLKLLKNRPEAAKVLEKGHYYQEAAEIYLRYMQDKSKAAECYENGKIYIKAIDLYKELGEKEKVGDLYLLLNDKGKANAYFMEVVDNYAKNAQYVKASLVYRNKIGDTSQAQTLLIDGWRTDKDAVNCLNNYFANIDAAEKLRMQINRVYTNDVDDKNIESFLQVIKHEFKKDPATATLVKNIAYEIISARIGVNPVIASELIFFNKSDTTISKDVMKYKLFSRQKNGRS